MAQTEITHRTGDYYGDGAADRLIWEIHDEDGVAAELYVHPTLRVILNIEVRSDRSGEGFARALYEAAMATGTIYHAPAWGCSEAGAGFADAVGGPVIDEEAFAELIGVDLADIYQEA